MSKWTCEIESHIADHEEKLFLYRVTEYGAVQVVQVTDSGPPQPMATATMADLMDGQPSEIDEMLQVLMDVAWDRGIRPSQLARERLREDVHDTGFHLLDMPQQPET